MPTTQKLHLEDCLEDTPQTRTFIDLFEKDAQMLKKFSKAFSSSFQKVLNAQVMMVSASQELSYYLRLYGKQNFPLDPALTENESAEEDENSLPATLCQFASHIDEISSTFQVLVTQLNDSIIYPLNKAIDNEFDELNSLSQMYQIASDEVDASMQRYLRVPNKKEYDQQRAQMNDEVYSVRKKFHQTALSYFTSLNTLQHKRKYMFTEPMLSCMHSLKLFFKMGAETFSSTSGSVAAVDDFVSKMSAKVCEIKEEMGDDMNKSNQLIELLQQDDSIYYAEHPLDMAGREETQEPITDSVVQKSGYLNLRSKFPFISKWDRSFYFIQNGYLMQQQKTEIAGYPFMELRSDWTISRCDIDDRQFTFQVHSQFPKKITYFQANSKRDCDEWIKILENAIKDENKAKILNHMNNLAASQAGSKSSPSPPLSDGTARKNSTSNRNDTEKVSFELETAKLGRINTKRGQKCIVKPEQGDSFKVRFLGSMSVRSDRGNEYINETIRQVMATRAAQNVFKLSEFTLVVNMESLNLFRAPNVAYSTLTNEPVSTLNNEDEQLMTQFDVADLAFWCTHRENERLFGFIIKEKQFKFSCLVFESDVNAARICESITKATQLAYQLLVDENKSEHFKKIKQTEKDILLQNINCLPDKKASPTHEVKNGSSQEAPRTQAELDTENEEFVNAANMAFSSPNPNFIVLDRELLENIQENSEPVASFGQTARKKSTSNSSETPTSNESFQKNGELTKKVESDA